MTGKNLYSIRMRALAGERHSSGAERIVPPDALESTVRQMIRRAREKQFLPEQITISIDDLGEKPLRALTGLDVAAVNAPDVPAGRALASRVLQSSGISRKAVEVAVRYLSAGAAPSGGNMRGAMIMDAGSGERLEPDQERGIRASRFDWSEAAFKTIQERLLKIGLTHHRTHEALALATKVVHGPGVVAELCWSDDADYTAGYVASLRAGYVRFPFLKQAGDPRGGRVFFVDRPSVNMGTLIRYLEEEAVLITDAGTCTAAVEFEYV